MVTLQSARTQPSTAVEDQFSQAELVSFLNRIEVVGNWAYIPQERIPARIFKKEVKIPLETWGGIYSVSKLAFEFPFDPANCVAQLVLGVKVNFRSTYHYFDTQQRISLLIDVAY